MADLIKVPVRCHCRTWLNLKLPSPALPLEASACHCRSCRLVSGQLAYFCATMPIQSWPTCPNDPGVMGFKTYKTSEHMTRCFCGTCGAHLLVTDTSAADEHQWMYDFLLGAVPATLENGQRTTKFTRHIFVQPDDDGALAPYFADDAPRFLGWSTDGKRVEGVAPTGSDAPPLEKLPLRCHCGNWKGSLVRPSGVSAPREEVRAKTIYDDKWRWGACACDSCRLTSGSPISTFVFVQKSAIETSDGGKLNHHHSSEGVKRSFCGGCGAHVYYQTENESEDELADLFMGLIDAPLAPVFRDWVWQSPQVDFAEDADDTELIAKLQKGWKRS